MLTLHYGPGGHGNHLSIATTWLIQSFSHNAPARESLGFQGVLLPAFASMQHTSRFECITEQLLNQSKHMLWVLKGTISIRWFFLAPKTHVYTNGYEKNQNSCMNCTIQCIPFTLATAMLRFIGSTLFILMDIPIHNDPINIEISILF